MKENEKKNPLFYSIGSRLRLPYILSSIKNLDKNSSCLDLGCGTGFFSSILAKKNFKVCGIDPDHFSLEKAKELYRDLKINFLEASAETIPLPDNFVDFFICSEVLEHVNSLEQTLKEAIRVSKKGTKFFITVPSKGIFGRFFLKIGHNEQNLYESDKRPPFNKKGITELLKKFNFKIEKCFYSKFIIAEIFMGLTKIFHNLKKGRKEISGQHDIIMPPLIYKIIFPCIYFICRLEDFILRHSFLPGHMIIIFGEIEK